MMADREENNTASSSSLSSPWSHIPVTTSPSFTSIVPTQMYSANSASITHGSSSSSHSQPTLARNESSSSKVNPTELTGQSSSFSSSASGTKAAQGKSRARVSMACIHCRQRKIRCDGSQPTCSICLRLGRDCTYESITEMENVFTREKKRRSKEIKLSRLKSLQGIGVSVLAQGLAQGPSSIQSSSSAAKWGCEGSSSSNNSNNQDVGTMRYRSGSSNGVIRDSRLIRQERNRPYRPVQQPTMQSSEQAQLHLSPAPLSIRRQISGSRNASEKLVLSSPASSRRGRSNTSITEHGVSRMTSLSQPTTPEATYSAHASMLSRELSQQDSTSGDIVTSSPFFSLNNITPSISLDGDPYSSGLAATSTTIKQSGLDFTPSPTYQSGDPSLSSRSSLGDATMATSTSSITQIASPYVMQRYMTDQQHDDLEAQLALRRRSSFDVGDFWKRTSVADAAVANFFDRVVQAKGARKDSGESENSSALQRYPIKDSQSFTTTTSSSGFTAINESPYTTSPMYSSIAQELVLPTGLAASPDHLLYHHHHHHHDPQQFGRAFNEEQQQHLSQEQQQHKQQHQEHQWQQDRLHGTYPDLHLGQLPEFHSHRQYPAHHTGGSNSSSNAGGNAGTLHSSGHFTPPVLSPLPSQSLQQHPLSAGLSNTALSFLTPPIPNIAPPPLPTPMTELSSNMFAMNAPSHLTYQNPSYLQDDALQMHQQQSMAAFVSSRHGSLSSSSIPEEEGEGEYR